MDVLFLFTKHLTDTGCYCLKLSAEGALLTPPELRTFAEITSLQSDCNTIVVETSTNASLHEVELPWLPERKARAALPYALEEHLAQTTEDLHFAFDKLRYHNKHYLISVINKLRIRYLMEFLKEKAIEFELITLDWFAIPEHTLCISEDVLLINNDDFKGALTGELAVGYLKKHLLNQPLIFIDSSIPCDNSQSVRDGLSSTWIAQQLLKNKPLNLCQGELTRQNTNEWITKGYQLVAALCGVWLLSLIFVNGISLYLINKKTAVIDNQIAIIYHQFFPEAKQVISPKFRINQLINANSSDMQARFWFLLNHFAKAMKNSSAITIDQLRYQNKTLMVTLTSPDFTSLENIEKKLTAAQLKVKQTQAATHEQNVVATLELT